MSNMFCFQCQQTAGGSACINTGVCGKQPSTSNLQDELVCELIKLAELSKNENKHSAVADRLIIDGLFTTLTNVNFDDNAIKEFMGRVKNEQNKISRPEAEKIQVIDLWDGDTDIVSLRSTLLFGLKGMAAYAHHAMNLGYTDNEVLKWFYKGLCEVNREHSVTEWIELIMEFGQVNFKCMELLDKANTESFGNPVPTRVNVDIKKGPFIVVSGHDLNDLSQLLEQTEKTGVNVYTHCEMLYGRTQRNEPSRFLREIEPEYIEETRSPVLEQRSRMGGWGSEYSDTVPGGASGYSGPSGYSRSSYGGGYGSGYSSGNRSGYLNREYNAGESRGFGSSYGGRSISSTGFGSHYGNSSTQPTTRSGGFGSAYSGGNATKNTVKQTAFTVNSAVKPAASGSKHYEPGDIVEHKVFGRGTVLKVKPAAGDQIVEINFEKVGIKKTMANFAPLTKITEEE